MRYSIVKTIALFLLVGTTIFGTAFTCSAAEMDTNDAVVFSSQDEISLSSTDMKDNRGASGTVNSVTSEQTLAAETSGNSLNVQGNLTNGNIYMGQNFGGLGSYVMNTGNNSTINSAVSVNIQMMTAPQTP